MSLKCAVELGIPDIINNHGKPMTISQLTLALLINKNKSHCLYRLMRLLTHSGFFTLEKIKIKGEEEEEEGYWILHDWSDENSVKILKKCKEAITKSGKKIGKVVVIDMIIENEKGEIDDESYETQLFMNMRMILVSGRERNEKELSKLFKDAGFSHYKITPILGLRSLIEIYP
ncbi:hypothetical protein F8388_018707 [Cannabis sativa]|uniref:Uncharacterized protein n=1 Tax=Cannabis sativa TaxID=3483 RepID=A0A7J6FD24_CANSA|nr:hypothetical protein F8388_018707 [Cannabis sativa]